MRSDRNSWSFANTRLRLASQLAVLGGLCVGQSWLCCLAGWRLGLKSRGTLPNSSRAASDKPQSQGTCIMPMTALTPHLPAQEPTKNLAVTQTSIIFGRPLSRSRLYGRQVAPLQFDFCVRKRAIFLVGCRESSKKPVICSITKKNSTTMKSLITMKSLTTMEARDIIDVPHPFHTTEIAKPIPLTTEALSRLLTNGRIDESLKPNMSPLKQSILLLPPQTPNLDSDRYDASDEAERDTGHSAITESKALLYGLVTASKVEVDASFPRHYWNYSESVETDTSEVSIGNVNLLSRLLTFATGSSPCRTREPFRGPCHGGRRDQTKKDYQSSSPP